MLLYKVAEMDKKKKKAIEQGIVVAAENGLDVVPGLGIPKLVGRTLYGAKEEHPVAGFFLGTPGVVGATDKDKGEYSGFIPAVAGGAVGAGALSALFKDKIHEGKIEALKHSLTFARQANWGPEVISAIESSIKHLEETPPTVLKYFGKGALHGAGASAILYGLGRLFGKKRQKKD